MPAQSQQQQKLFGLALAFKRGEIPASEVSDEIKDIADRMSEKEIEDFAATKHKGLPKMKEQLRKIVREIMREKVISEMNEESVNESTDCGCGCAGTTPGGCGGKSITEVIKGRNNKTGESFGMVIGSDKKNREGDFEVTIRKGYSSRISSYGFVFDKDSNLISIKDYGYSMDGKFPDMKGHASSKSVRPNGRETIIQIAKITSPAFAKKIVQHVKKVNESIDESVNEGPSTEEKRIAMLAVRKQAKYRNVSLEMAIQDQINALEELKKDIKKGKKIK